MTATPHDASTSGGDNLLGVAAGLLGTSRSRHAQRLATTIALGALGQRAWTGYTQRRARDLFTVSVYESDEIWAFLHGRLLDMIPEDQRRVLVASTRRTMASTRAERALVSPSGPGVARSLQLFYDGSRPQRFTLNGQPVEVAVERLVQQTGQSDGTLSAWLPAKIVFTARNLAGRRAVEEFLDEATADYEKARTQPSLLVAARWNDWQNTGPLPTRPLDTVILDTGVLESIIAGVDRFLTSRDDYTRLGIPWHHGLLFHGPPGTGKTSTVKALASTFGLDLYVLSIADVTAEMALNQLLGNVKGPAVLLMEDLDSLAAARDREADHEAQTGITTTGLLQALDGVVTPDGLISVISTNHPDALDPALVRPGRIDQNVPFGYVTGPQLRRLITTFVGIDPGPVRPRSDGLTHAEVIDAVKSNLGDTDLQMDALVQLLAIDITTG